MSEKERIDALLDRVNAEVAQHGVTVRLVSYDVDKVTLAVNSNCGPCEFESNSLRKDLKTAFSQTLGNQLEVTFA